MDAKSCLQWGPKAVRVGAQKPSKLEPKSCPSWGPKIFRVVAQKLSELGPKSCPSWGPKPVGDGAQNLSELRPKTCPSQGLNREWILNQIGMLKRWKNYRSDSAPKVMFNIAEKNWKSGLDLVAILEILWACFDAILNKARWAMEKLRPL